MALAVRHARPEELEAVVAILVAAFHDDPVYRTSYPDAALFDAQLADWFRLSIGYEIHFGETYVTEDFSAAAVWAPPGAPSIHDELKEQREALLSAQVGAEGAARRMQNGQAVSGPPQTPHWYLGYLGVLPARQGVGIGSEVLRPILERVDREQMPVFLYSTNTRNVPFYERLGCQVQARDEWGAGGPIMTSLLREPQTPTGA